MGANGRPEVARWFDTFATDRAVQLFGLYSFLCVRGVKIGAAVLKLLFCCDIIILTRTV